MINMSTSYYNYFKDKNITILGLGLLGRGVNVAKFLAQNGANVLVTDLKTKKELESSLKQLKEYNQPKAGPHRTGNIKYVLGKHRKEDFKNKDLIIKTAGVPLDSPYIKEARKNKTPVKMDASLFIELAPKGITTIGVTGTKGKSTVTNIIYDMIRNSGKRTYLGGNVRGIATLPLLNKVKKGDFIVLELDSWQLQGFGESKISPHIAVFTNFMPDHLNYYKGSMKRYFTDKANIFKYQTKEDILVCGKEVSKKIKTKGKKIIVSKDVVPKTWKTIKGRRYKENLSLAIKVGEVLGIKKSVIKKTIEGFNGVPGRLEFIKKIYGVEYYNDTTATMPEATIYALETLSTMYRTKSKKIVKNIILIAGGADKKLNYKKLTQKIKTHAKILVLFKGEATEKLKKELGKTKIPTFEVTTMKDAVACAYANSEAGDVVLLSPGAASFGLFKNEFDRGDQFIEEVKKYGHTTNRN